jgi:hypothetical protein
MLSTVAVSYSLLIYGRTEKRIDPQPGVNKTKCFKRDPRVSILFTINDLVSYKEVCKRSYTQLKAYQRQRTAFIFNPHSNFNPQKKFNKSIHKEMS